MKYYIGQSESISKEITKYDIYNFADLSGDFNPIHVNKEKAEKSVFKRQVVHGMLVSSLISTVLGMYLPGPGTIYLKQTLEFKKPVYIGDTIIAIVTIIEINNEKNIAKLKTIVKNQEQVIVVEGEAVVKLP